MGESQDSLCGVHEVASYNRLQLRLACVARKVYLNTFQMLNLTSHALCLHTF